MARKLRVGVIGTGFGSQVQLPAFRAHPRVELVALASGQPGKAAAVAGRFGVPLAFDDYTALVKADLDLVSITTPPDLHHPMTMAALARGRHVICEKPMALSAVQAGEMLHEAERRGVIHLIDHELRFNPTRRRIKSLIDEGFIGYPRYALFYSASGRADSTRPWTWWSDAARGGGILGAFGSHQIDLLRHLLGEIGAVSGTVATYGKTRRDQGSEEVRAVTADDYAAFALRFVSGATGVAMISGVAAHPSGPRLELSGDGGTLVLDDKDRLWGARRGREFEELTVPETLSMPPGMDYSPLWGLSFVRLVDHVVSVALDGAPVPPAATFRDGLQVQRVIDAIRASSQDGWLPVLPPDR